MTFRVDGKSNQVAGGAWKENTRIPVEADTEEQARNFVQGELDLLKACSRVRKDTEFRLVPVEPEEAARLAAKYGESGAEIVQ